ncbi:deoxyribodipyrimidine photo-lyase [candidate division WWE3 bacterium]|nr:deoxyribodipyrimidine photo-lyase [candidate division WWE3 bacterium]
MVDLRRVHQLNKNQIHQQGSIIYWMSRDQRVHNNWALIYAQELALARKSSLSVIFSFDTKFQYANLRNIDFMLHGIQETFNELQKLNISATLLFGNPIDTVTHYVTKNTAGVLVTDFSPLKIGRGWRNDIAQSINIPMVEVDAHNIVPVWVTSSKQEYGAYTIRPKIKKLLPEFLTQYPDVIRHPFNIAPTTNTFEYEDILTRHTIDRSVTTVKGVDPGEKAARNALREFIKQKLANYDADRNDPSRKGQSNIAPYLHFGHISSQEIANEVKRSNVEPSLQEGYLEELIVRKELSDNFCFYNSNYDSTDGFPDWAKQTLQEHESDKRPYLYTIDDLESANTHDQLWNAAQKEMTMTGKMHGYMRMYWGKKILEWTINAQEAVEYAIYLNDKYELDGRDPNGYAGIAWSMGGVHDRPWNKRPIFGNIRYMNDNGAKRKFDVNAYIETIKKL